MQTLNRIDEKARALFPTRALALLLLIGFIDLVATFVLHRQGLIVELNPLMRPFIEKDEWLFAAVKGGTLLAAWAGMASHARSDLVFVRRAALAGSALYVTVWTTWFLSSMPRA